MKTSNMIPDNAQAEPPALLYEMVRSFVSLARTLNLSHSVEELGSTRQTVRRHIAQLEEAIGQSLFRIEDRQYYLAEIAEELLPEAEDFLARGRLWLRGNTRHVDHLQYISQAESNGWSFRQQQQPISEVWVSSSLLMRETMRAWAMSGGMIEAPEIAHVRDYLIIYRRSAEGWLCVGLGEKSFYSGWFGWAKARSSIGKPLGKLPGGREFGTLVEQSFSEVATTQSARLDHIITQVPRGPDNALCPIGYARLLLGGRFPDNSLALLALVEPTANINLKGVKASDIPPVPADLNVVMPESEAKFRHVSVE